MPDRRIDAIGKADAALWNSVHLSKGSPNLLKIISGQLSRLPAGEVMSAVVQKASKGAFKITLNGETFIIRGIPATLLGKAVSFVARPGASAGKGGIELLWLGPSRVKNNVRQATAQTTAKSTAQTTAQTIAKNTVHTTAQTTAKSTPQQARVRVNILSGLTADLMAHGKSGKVIHARIDSIQAANMTLSLSLADPKNPARNIAHQIQTTVIHALKPGQQFAARIQVGVNHKPALEILPQQAMSLTGVKAAVQTSPPLQMASFAMEVGDIAPALVQKRLANGHIQLNIQGITVETSAPKTISQGDLLMLRMIKPPAEFQFISVQKNTVEKAMTIVKNNLPVSHQPLAQSITAIGNLMPTLIKGEVPNMNGIAVQLETWLASSQSPRQQPLNGERLAQLIHASGAGLESKLLGLAQKSIHNPAALNDLKALMLQLSSLQGSNIKHAEIIRALTELSQHSVSRIESNQALNVLAQIHGDPIRYEFPMLVGQQLINVQMSLQQQYQQPSDDSEQDGGSEQTFSVLFALDLSGLGNMRVDASISDITVHARIYSEQADVSQFIRDHIQRLETRLQSLGYKDVFLLATNIAPDTEKQRRFDQLTSMAPASMNLLDVIA